MQPQKNSPNRVEYNQLKFQRWSRELAKKEFQSAQNPKLSLDMRHYGIRAHYRFGGAEVLVYRSETEIKPCAGFLHADLSNQSTEVPFRLSNEYGYVDVLFLEYVDDAWYKFEGRIAK